MHPGCGIELLHNGIVSAFADVNDMWLNLAASRASGGDQKQFGEMLDTGAAKTSPAQIAEA